MTAGYSGTSQARKLGIKSGQRVHLDGPPHGWQLVDAPVDVVYVNDLDAVDVVVSFMTSVAELSARLPALVERIFPDGALWIAWPRRAAGHHSDMTEAIIREKALPLGVVDVKVAAIDNDWSGLRLVWRLTNRVAKPVESH